MPVVSNTVLDPGGTPVRVVVTIRLIAGDTGYEPGYTDDGVVAGIVRLTSDDDGLWSATLESNADITPANSYYEVLERLPGRAVAYQHYISVPDGAGPYELPAILVADPDSPDELAIAASQKGAANGVATLDASAQVPLNQLGNAAGGVTLTNSAASNSTFGDAATVGAATTAARGDHKHGREAIPTAAEVGAAATSHSHAASDVNSGTLGIARIPTGSTSSTVALGDHTHSGNTIVVRSLRVEEATDLTFPSTSSAWQFLSGFAVTVPAAAGDYVELTWNFMWAVTTGNNFLDWHVNVSNAIVRAMSSDTATPKTEGAPWLYPGVASFDKSPGPWGFVVTAPMLSAGNLTCQLAAKSVGTGTIYRSTTYPFTARLKNFGPCDVA